jgi:hypothetical protein
MGSLGRRPDDTRLPDQPGGDPVHGAPALLAINLALGIASLGAQFAELYWLLFPGLILWSLVIGSAMVLIALRQGAAECRECSGRR